MKLTFGQLVGALVVIVAIGVGAYFITSKLGKTTGSSGARQAVFLTNGQVYFGKIKNPDKKTVTLTDIYYLQVQQNLQQGQTTKEGEQPQVSLVKLGNELHGPMDEMRINRDHILFIEDMKDSSKVNEAIANFVRNGSQSTATPTPAP